MTCITWAVENGVRAGRARRRPQLRRAVDDDRPDDRHQRPQRRDGRPGDRASGQVAGAALNGDVLDKTIHTPFLLPGGTCLGVGTGGLVLGGGIGYNTHWAGLTCDHLTSTRVVLASGEVVEADATNHPDLFWACRGGTGGNFGINTVVHVPARRGAGRPSRTSATTSGAPTTRVRCSPRSIASSRRRPPASTPAPRRRRRPSAAADRARRSTPSPGASTSARPTSCATCSPRSSPPPRRRSRRSRRCRSGTCSSRSGPPPTRRRTRSATGPATPASRCPTTSSPR